LNKKGKQPSQVGPTGKERYKRRVERGRAQDKGLFTEEPKFPLERQFISIYATETH
jgi:hypothetical protein